MNIVYKSIGEYITPELEKALDLCSLQRTIFAMSGDESSLNIVHMLSNVIRAEMHRRSI